MSQRVLMNKNKLYKNILIFLCMLPFSKGDTEVSCVFMERCILPCSFTDGAADFIKWIHLSPEVSELAHRYYNKEKHEDQGQNYTNRTSLFMNQISNGNASLQLTGVKIQDQGRYHCYTKTITGIQKSSILLKVDAPVSKISFDRVGNRITCSSNWIYPEPELTWSTSPPSNMSLQNTASVQQTEQQLYNISSSLILSDSDTHLIYSCIVSTRTSSRRATWRQISSLHANYTEATISCSASNTSLTSLIWRFNHSQIILNKPGPDVTPTVSEEWRQHVKEVSESGSLTLQNLTSHQEGTYTCELSNSEETMITVISLRMNSDTEVSCVFMERCILPCSFTDGAADFIKWIHLSPEVSELAHYYNKEKHEDQGQNYTNRTSLFMNQISNGNASLQLTGVKIQDQGRYHCYTKTITGIQKSSILLKVDAPVSKISFDRVGNRITCSSNWIHPEPELTWSTSPPSNMSLQNTTSVQTEQQLYNISSSLILSDSDTHLIYSCIVSTRTSSRRATWRQISSLHANYTEATISCSASNTSLTSLIWRFNHSQIILNKPGPDVTPTVSEEWRQHVKDVSESGSLTLQNLTSHQEGTYTCELSNSEETMITVISLRMNSENSVNVGGIIGGVFAAAAAVVVVGPLIFWKKRKGQQDNNRRSNNEEINIRMEVQGADEGLISDFCRVSSDDNQMSSPSSPLQFSEADSAV
ncbi:CD276 antigen-like isoform 1-T2 [Odontesthes bonariensis]|uniref:CD276 antigen-like n=1 Tax=Odontesthes bonariensis TaxID=219752 RepID=UPI003F584A77